MKALFATTMIPGTLTTLATGDPFGLCVAAILTAFTWIALR